MPWTRRLEFRHLRKRRKRVSALRLDMGCLCGNLEENPSLSSIPTGQLFRSTYLIREGTIENRPYKAWKWVKITPTFGFWKMGFDHFYVGFLRNAGNFGEGFGRFWSNLWPFAHFLPTFKTPIWSVKTQYLCGFAGSKPTFPLFFLNYYDRKFKSI